MSGKSFPIEKLTPAQRIVLKRTLRGMWNRCTDPNVKGYRVYGARGITVCERWRTFENFVADMGPRPKGRSIDRIDNDGNYEPGNCRWATRAQQFANRANCTYVFLAGKGVTIRTYTRLRKVTTTQVMQMIAAGLLAECCPKAHIFTPDNVYQFKRPGKNTDRCCRTCRYIANKKAVRKLQAAKGGKTKECPHVLPPHLARNLNRQRSPLKGEPVALLTDDLVTQEKRDVR